VITDLVPDDLTPAERLRGAVQVIRDHLTKLKESNGLIGAKSVPFQFLVAVQTEQGMGVLLALPGDEFLADVEAVASEPKGVSLDPTFFAWSEADAPLWATDGSGPAPAAPEGDE
jgi:hypothetical protein